MVDRSTSGLAHRIPLAGEFDLCNRGALSATLDCSAAHSARWVEIDISAVEFIDASCIGVIDRFACVSEQRGTTVRVGATPFQARLFGLSKFPWSVEVGTAAAG